MNDKELLDTFKNKAPSGGPCSEAATPAGKCKKTLSWNFSSAMYLFVLASIGFCPSNDLNGIPSNNPASR